LTRRLGPGTFASIPRPDRPAKTADFGDSVSRKKFVE